MKNKKGGGFLLLQNPDRGSISVTPGITRGETGVKRPIANLCALASWRLSKKYTLPPRRKGAGKRGEGLV